MYKILITGGSQGIGFAITKELFDQGHELFITGRDSNRLKEVMSKFPNKVHGVSCQLGKPGEIERLVQKTKGINFHPDVIILNAASFGNPERSVIKPTSDELREVLEVNVVSSYEMVKSFIEIVKEGTYPRIIIIGSTASIRRDDDSIYGISKWALRSYSYYLRDELKNLGVGVTLINPGGTFTQKRISDETTPEGRLLEAKDIGILVAAILSLSPQAVVEEINIRPMLGDTY